MQNDMPPFLTKYTYRSPATTKMMYNAARDLQTATTMARSVPWMSGDDQLAKHKRESIITWMKDIGFSNFKDE